jgi:hypothetical protein
MNTAQFDALTKRLGTARTRRSLLTIFAAGIFGSAGAQLMTRPVPAPAQQSGGCDPACGVDQTCVQAKCVQAASCDCSPMHDQSDLHGQLLLRVQRQPSGQRQPQDGQGDPDPDGNSEGDRDCSGDSQRVQSGMQCKSDLLQGPVRGLHVLPRNQARMRVPDRFLL